MFNERILSFMGLDKVHSKNHVRPECKFTEGKDDDVADCSNAGAQKLLAPLL